MISKRPILTRSKMLLSGNRRFPLRMRHRRKIHGRYRGGMNANLNLQLGGTRRIDPNLSKVSTVRRFAMRGHGDQMYGFRPYVYHLDQVDDLVKPYGLEARIVAYLHDLLEDSEIRPRQIYLEFGQFVLECCELLKDPDGDTRVERKRLLHERLSKVGPSHHLALVVKVGDRLANVRACVADSRNDKLEMYRLEHAEFRAAVYRPGLCDPLWRQLNAIMLASSE